MCLREILTPKQWQIANLVADGEKNETIAKQIGTTHNMVKNFMVRIYDRTGLWNRVELALAVVHHEFTCSCEHAGSRLGVPDVDRSDLHGLHLQRLSQHRDGNESLRGNANASRVEHLNHSLF
jgi:DNA-binding CsgD family transcriptional regulator